MASLYTPWALRAAATLRLADAVDDGATTAQQLAERTGCDTDALARLTRHLVSIGVFTHDPDAGIGLDWLGRALLSSHSSRVVELLDQRDPMARSLDEVTPDLLSTVSSGEPSWGRRYGTDFWSYVGAGERSRSFDVMMETLGQQVGREVAALDDWSTVGTVADVGGGTGAALATLLHAHPHLEGVLVDRLDTAERARARFASEGLASRVRIHGQSFFDHLPTSADVYLLTRVLHDWPDPDCVRILAGCREAAAGRGATVMIAEQLFGDDQAGDKPAVSGHDLVLMVTVGGRNRSARQFSVLAAEAGLALADVVSPTPTGKYSLVKLVPAADAGDRR